MSQADFRSQPASQTSPTSEASGSKAATSETFLDQVLGQSDSAPALETSGGKDSSSSHSLEEFLSAASVGESLAAWLGDDWEHNAKLDSTAAVARRLSADVAVIDGLLNQQLNAVLHHQRFQKLESSWRGLKYLTDRADQESDPMIQVRVMTATWKELDRDFERASEFDQSHLFKKIYESEFGQAGGQPFTVLLGDYDVHPRVSREKPTDDVAILRTISGIAASAFCPFLCAASPEMLDLQSFSELQVTRDHAERLSRTDYLKWNALRETEDARFVGMLLPRILMRGPYADDGSRIDGFPFDEDVADPTSSDYLWGNPIYAYATVLMRAFSEGGWLADIRGLRQDEEGGGLVTDLPSLSFPTDSRDVIPRPVTEVSITDTLERQLSDVGMVSLCDCKDTQMAVFASGQSIQKPKQYSDLDATANAKISAMLPYIFTVSRFAHYVKVIARDKTGSVTTAKELETILQDWIIDYVTADREASTEIKSRKPLRRAEITVNPDPGRPGSFFCVMHLSPHYELDEMVGSVRLTTRLGSG
ncbi:MAG: type VI secretion system contractile sheath large subunit [Planctomycetota bacterium]